MEKCDVPLDHARRTHRAMIACFTASGAMALAAIAVSYYLFGPPPQSAIVAAFVGGFALNVWLFNRLRPAFRCPQCGWKTDGPPQPHPAVNRGKRIRFACRRCGIDWDPGTSTTSGLHSAAPDDSHPL